jgi:hypothetical protein
MTHIGEYDAKTNALRFLANSHCTRIRPRAGLQRRLADARVELIVRGFSVLVRRLWSAWGDFAEGRPEW